MTPYLTEIEFNGTVYQLAAPASGGGQGQGSGISASAQAALAGFFSQMAELIPSLAFASSGHNGPAALAAAQAAAAAFTGGSESGGDTPVQPVFYTVTKTLTHCALSNSAGSVAQGSGYSAVLTVNSGYVLSLVSVTMGGVDMTASAWNSGSGTVTIGAVTGNVVITATAAARTLSSISAAYDGGGRTVRAGDSLDSLKPYLTVTAAYTDGTTETLSASDYTLSGTLTVGTSTVTVSFGGKTDTFTVTVEAAPAVLSSISALLNLNGTTITTNNSLNDLKQYLTVTATYSDSSTATVASTDYTLSGTLTVGTSTVTVTYSGKTTTFNVTVSNPSYTAETIYSNYTATGQRFSTGDISIDFAAGDYVEAVIDASSEDVVSQTNLISVAKDGNNDYLDFSTGEAVLVYKRDQSGTMKVLFRIKDTANSVAIDKWVVPNDFSNLVIKIDKNGVYLDGTAVSGVSASTLAFLTGQSKIAIGARATKLSYATYSSVKVYRLQ